MNVNSYIFQSPYSSSVQVGRPDPNANTQENKEETLSAKDTNQTLKNAEMLQTSNSKEVTPSVKSANKLDIYA
jgi:hypothetical protein